MPQDDFGKVGEAYQRYSNDIRGRVRHELVFEVVVALTPPGGSVLDMGCGDGEISGRLAEAGFTVLGVDASPEMLQRARERKAALAQPAFDRLDYASGDIATFSAARTFDAVCCHGVLMYLEDSAAAVRALADHVKPGGLLSILSRNAQANGFREALRGDYRMAKQLVETGVSTSMGNLGIETRGDDPRTILRHMEACGFSDCQWQGVRIFSDHLDAATFEHSLADDLIALERLASTREPYRSMARLFHATGLKVR